MDNVDKTNLNLIVYGNTDEKRNFFRVIDMLIDSDYRAVSECTCYHLSGNESIDNYCLFDIFGKRIKIRDRTCSD